MAPVARIVDKGAEMHAVIAGKVLEQVKGANLVTLVGWIRNAVREKQQLFHPLTQMSGNQGTDKLGDGQRQMFPELDEQPVLRVQRIDVGDLARSDQTVFVSERLG